MEQTPANPMSFADLPEDIGRLIFELVAYSDHTAGLSCALVSKTMKSWVEPVLYRYIIIRNPSAIKNLYHVIRDPKSTKPRHFFAAHVKSLVIIDSPCDPHLPTIYNACRGVQYLALWNLREYMPAKSDETVENLRAVMFPPESPRPPVLVSPDALSPRRLSITSHIFPPDQLHFGHSLFRDVTHFDLVWPVETPLRWETLGDMANLTHMSFDPISRDSYLELVKKIISSCPQSLRVFIIWVDSISDQIEESEETSARLMGDLAPIHNGDVDPRAIIAYMGFGSEVFLDAMMTGCIREYMVVRLHDDLLRDSAGMSVGKDFWTLAEETIELRRRRAQRARR